MDAKELWLNQISQHIDILQETPLFGKGFSFDFSLFSSMLSQELGGENLVVRLKSQECLEDISLKSPVHAIFLSPIDEPLFWTMSRENRELLSAKMLSPKSRKKAFTSAVLQEGFYRFILLEALNTLNEMDPFQQMTLQLKEEVIDHKMKGVLIDIEIAIEETSCWAQLIIPESFRKKWVQHFAAFPSRYIPTRLTQSLQMTVGVQIGWVDLDTEELQTLKKGDILLPDHLYENSEARLTIGQTDLFHLKIQDRQIQIAAYAFNTEEIMEETQNLSQELEKTETELSAIQNLPIQIHIELARLTLPLDKLMHLSPGNVLDLPEHTEKKIQLSVNGKKIGVAELVQIGDKMGLKILEI